MPVKKKDTNDDSYGRLPHHVLLLLVLIFDNNEMVNDDAEQTPSPHAKQKQQNWART